MKRHLFNVLALASLLLCLASLGLWIRSYFGDGGGWEWNLYHRTFHLGMSRGSADFDYYPYPRVRPTHITSIHQALGVTFWHGTMGEGPLVGVLFWLWMPSAVFSLFPIVYLIRYRRRTKPPGHCPTCGYDLRATPDRCPECGHLPEKVKSIP